jgi:hypothetical protein
MLDTVDNEGLTAEAAEFAECTATVRGALRRFVAGRGADPAELYGDPIERAVAGICRADLSKLGSRHARMIAEGLGAVARLHYARHHSNPLHPAAYLWSAVCLFRMVSRTPYVQIPEDITLMLGVLAADDPDAVPGLDDAATAADTAARLLQYADAGRDLAALSSAETLIHRVLDTTPTSDPNRVIYLNTLLAILTRRWEWTGTGLADEVLPLVDLVDAPAHRADPRWPDLQANAGAACYSAAVRTHSGALLDRSIDLVGSAVGALPDDWPGKAGFLQNLGRAELIRWIWRDQPGTSGDAVAHLERAVVLTVRGDPYAAERHAWLAMALLTGDCADPAGAAQQLEAADALAGVPGVQMDGRLLGETWLMLWRARPDDDAPLDRAIALLTRARTDSSHHAPGDGQDSLSTALWERWERTRDMADIDEVIARLTARADGPDAPPLLLNLLARALRARWERTGDSIAIRHAIDCLMIVVQRSPPDDSATSMYLNNLGAMWLRLHEATGDAAALQCAVQYARQVLGSCPDGDMGRPMYANNAALAVLRLSELTGSGDILALAVQMSRTAAAITPDDHPDRVSHLANLGAVLAQAAIRSRDAIVLDEAIEVLESALRTASPEHPAYGGLTLSLGETLLIRGRAQGSDDTVARGQNLIRQGAGLAHLHPETAVRAARRSGDEAAAAGDWGTAAAALRDAVERLAQLPGHRLDRFDHERLLVRLAGLATDAAAACHAAGDDRHAVESLELGRGILLAKTLRDDHSTAALRRRDPALAAQLADVQSALWPGNLC